MWFRSLAFFVVENFMPANRCDRHKLASKLIIRPYKSTYRVQTKCQEEKKGQIFSFEKCLFSFRLFILCRLGAFSYQHTLTNWCLCRSIKWRHAIHSLCFLLSIHLSPTAFCVVLRGQTECKNGKTKMINSHRHLFWSEKKRQVAYQLGDVISSEFILATISKRNKLTASDFPSWLFVRWRQTKKEVEKIEQTNGAKCSVRVVYLFSTEMRILIFLSVRHADKT